jgi:hypothetical protein
MVVKCSFMVNVSVCGGMLTITGNLRRKNVITPKNYGSIFKIVSF